MNYLLTWDMEVYAIDLRLKSVEHKEKTYDKFEDLLSDYRRLKNALAYQCINYNKNFKVYRVSLEEQPLSLLDSFIENK